MRPKQVFLSALAASLPIPVNHSSQNFQISLGCDLIVGGTLTYSVQYTFDDIGAAGYNPATGNWQDHPTLSAKTTSNASNLAFPVRAVRLNVTAYTSGTVRLTLLQTASGT